MPLAVVGVSHRTAPVDVRERLAFGPADASRALLTLRKETGVEEAVLLSTCNRTEVYLYPSEGNAQAGAVEFLLERKAGPLERPVQDYLFRHDGERVVHHLFQVSSGLDSMVTGEAEIQGQVREAYELATSLPVDPPMAGPVLNRLFQMALAVGGRVRTETPISEGTASVASVAVELTRKIFGSLREKRVMVLGAGSTAERVVEALSREGVRGVLVVNRTHERAVELAERLRGHAVDFGRLSVALQSADIVLASTSAPHHVLSRETFRRAFPEGRSHPLLIIDIALPRDVDPTVGDEPEVFLYNVDDLHKIVQEHVRIREGAIPEAEGIIRLQSREFRNWYASLQAVPVIQGIRARAEAHRSSEMERFLRGMDHLSEEDRARVQDLSRRLMNKLLHEPTSRLRRGSAGGEWEELVNAARYLYGVEERDGGAPEAEAGQGFLGRTAAESEGPDEGEER
jgi:glutamyl-tRNA reductase